ncbi:sulfatase-like hydrolase/transferase [Paenibacillus sp. SYP-B4298]|uniref:sulfatase-like hydrolase/transferase n=1 Tax=Paenibacillus sp. SYP-B4298 TaxID=2996034 RepID=UPI0022DDB3F5|nr:sulfatase-like hydrolase/transferase [Paenibacillus sp. SYP-B4298]
MINRKKMNSRSMMGYVLPLLGLPFLTLAMTEMTQRSSLSSFAVWLGQYPAQWFSGYLLLLAVMLILLLVVKRIYWAFILLNTASIGVATVSQMKLKYRGEPLLPWDFKLGGEAMDVSAFFSVGALASALLPLAIATALGVLMSLKLRAPNYRLLPRVLLGVVGCVLVLGLFGGTMKARTVFALEAINWDQKLNYEQNGMMVGLLLSAQWMDVQQPGGYTKGNVQSISIPPGQTGQQAGRSAQPVQAPNIIIVMSEAFWDPTRLEHVQFSRDPLPFFHELSRQATSGRLLVPVYGGGTVNTEFEVLTSLSTQLLPTGSIAYANYVRKPLDSLASILKGQGYDTAAVHTYHNWFYRRNEVYRLLGFNRFVSGEFFSNPELRSGYIADQELSKRIIDEVNRSEQPSFIYAVSMENHGPYRLGKNKENTVKVSGLGEESTAILETYTQALTDADESLKMLVEAFKDSSEPTMIVFFGDHLPMLGEDYSVYKEAGYFEDSVKYEDYLNMFNVPFVIWDNFTSGEQGSYNDTYISAFELGPLVLDRAGVQGNELTRYVDGMFRKGLTFLPRQDFYAQAGIDERLLDGYSLLHYDRLFGEGYSYSQRPAASEPYWLGSGPIEIDRVEPLNPDGGEADKTVLVQIKGKNFVSQGIVYANGEPVETTFVSGNEVQARLPRPQPDMPVQVVIQVNDSLNRVISSSDPYTFEALQ